MDATFVFSFALAAGAGAFLRYICSTLVERISRHIRQHPSQPLPQEVPQKWGRTPAFPWSIFIVNILGCLGFGMALGITQNYYALSEEVSRSLFMGFFGSFTTYSTFIFEIYFLWKNGYYLSCINYLAGQILLGIAALWLGMQIFS